MSKIIFTGGGTGGHVFPIIAIAESIREKDSNVEMLYIGPRDFTTSVFLPRAKIRTNYIFSGKIRRYFSPKAFISNIVDIFFNIPVGFIHSFLIMFFAMPDLIVSKGGYGSVPVIFSGLLLRVPIFIHESDVAPGLSNKISGRFAKRIFTSFSPEITEYFVKSKMIQTGGPVRRSIINWNKEDVLKLKGGKDVIFIIGGSQGSEKINDVIFQFLGELLKDFEIIHQTGMKDINRAKNESIAMVNKELLEYYHPYFFLDEKEIACAYNLADVVVGRAGGGMISEVSSIGKPSVLIPLNKSAQNHQAKNAYAYAKNGACLVLEEPNFTGYFLLEKLKIIDREKMSQAAKEFSLFDASEKISKEIIEYLK
ncbi:MAG: UDP-N-acetylglucosamine--N-acetylmuramyl-(pentapeptide) pyrophosphoryl-undecaprenol N-acetylglucosamine transferase [Candidatus Pacebacteria bacterium]|nr:UDP-N-acetylglucosamine--N-acetylmuramyl-(pentapeptide) pyrophosphoryl-undecaprenol N-acetylglucosamine transferase [Candidatus Paceibacterota bacterium]MDD2757071.1 UDP-N-acetylglucosamine--N-acetylmuramyl-(pentapeptide) pyrophosphoryl-undecaprenol N-acetylglucosamine transferase [Candidatus Paceibacterota bacterium]MDD3283691.1 UDP-N-acetylglucosamine--N-acetylmuramyl-(pentapeptide) pyrophosphoryl-undecaprenol N-acetylglucosamine transferase [Candidatus Paceibacterota bacterium]MDD3969834.1